MANEKLPPPMVPIEVDLTDFKYMPLEIERLRRSRAWLMCRRRPQIGFYMLNLWTGSWHERPAGSLEDDDDVLADVAMCSPEKWSRVRTDVLRGWVKCSDNRLYHPVVCENAISAYQLKVLGRWRKDCDKIRKENKKREQNQQIQLPFPAEPLRISILYPPDFKWKPHGIPAENALNRIEGNRIEEKEEDSAAASSSASARATPKTEDIPWDDQTAPNGHPPPKIVQRETTLDAATEAAFVAYGDAATKHGWRDAMMFTSTRRHLIAARLSECGGIEGWRSALAKAAAADFLRGKRFFDLDWMIKPQNFIAIMEGKYDHDEPTRPNGSTVDTVLATLAREGNR